jgi:hypothetical protein
LNWGWILNELDVLVFDNIPGFRQPPELASEMYVTAVVGIGTGEVETFS